MEGRVEVCGLYRIRIQICGEVRGKRGEQSVEVEAHNAADKEEEQTQSEKT